MLGFSPLPRTLEAALRDAEHAEQRVRLSALSDLKRWARQGAEPALSALERLLAADPEPELRAGAALALADVDGRKHLEQLISATRDSDDKVRQMALLAVGELAAPEDEAARAAARAALDDAQPAIRYQALVALARLAREEAESAIVAATRDADAEVRHVAFRVAEEIFGDKPASEAPLLLLQRARAALRDDNPAVILAAAILLSVMADSAGTERVVEIINQPRPIKHVEDEVMAIELCGELRLQAATPGLERRAFGWMGGRDPVSWHARVALAELGHARAKAVILSGLSAWSRDKRTLAVAAAGRARLVEAREALERMQGDPTRAEPEAVSDALAQIATAGQQRGA
jgi:HEAT repeat protein